MAASLQREGDVSRLKRTTLNPSLSPSEGLQDFVARQPQERVFGGFIRS